LKNHLIDQSLYAVKFIQNSWPELLEKATIELQPWLNEIDEVYLCGCGDSHHAALGIEFAFDLWSGRKVRAAPAMFMSRYLIPRLKNQPQKILVIGISASGEVARTIEAIELANNVGAKTLAFTSNSESSLAQCASARLTSTIPFFSGPGLLSYIGSLLMGYASCAVLANSDNQKEISSCMEDIPSLVEQWIPLEMEKGSEFAVEMEPNQACVFIAGGSLLGSAIFAAAKVIEANGSYAWAQELEEWAHLEYFCDPAEMPTWFLSAGGRTASREREIFEAARTIGRKIRVSQWEGSLHWNSSAREALSPLGLWAGPSAYAARLAERFNSQPFRDFGGGRNPEEGGGASRIRSSARISTLSDL